MKKNKQTSKRIRTKQNKNVWEKNYMDDTVKELKIVI